MPRTRFVLVLVLVALSAGCLFDSPDQTETRVTEVVDGDTIRVSVDGTTETIRIIGIDTPETRGAVSPNEFGLEDTEANRACLQGVADDATMFVEERTGQRTVTLQAGSAVDNRGRYGRLLRYVTINNETDLGKSLVKSGYARVYEASSFSQKSAYREAAKTARANDRGFWGCDAMQERVYITTIRADAAGDDRTNLNDEYIIITNGQRTSVSTQGWVIEDAVGKRLQIPKRTLGPNEHLTVRTGSGIPTATTVYWNSTSPVWNNGGDTVTVRTENRTVAQRTYG